ncbi:DNA-binding transcriptional regulator, MerR family [Promicromonospora umidemergens]|uniref:HTH merR-type domain-containing protein n=1 Tax=Promicromonospora umidemergens TaxID=629679 RepID=A0ABP8XKT9_9MICO|nr:heavy metal-responsive transcriptional regulator [Promicromonospora umidemergens]MCP2282069.1 DNA-binding transcriptional regulator, MerR family [Promicromonospora umidemergens]
MLIGELADTVGLPAQTIRFYERQGLLPQPRRQANGYRAYDDTALARVQFIRNAQAAGLTLVEIGSIVELRDNGHRPCTHVTNVLRTKLDAVHARQAELAALEHELEHLVARSNDLDPADCTDTDICHILTRGSGPGPGHRAADTSRPTSYGNSPPK